MFFCSRQDCGQLGLSTYKKMTSALRQLNYTVPADATNEYFRIGKSTANEALKYFIQHIIDIYGAEYLRRPNTQEL